MRGIAEIKDYGKVIVKLKAQMDQKGISIYQMSKLTNLKYTTIKYYYNNEPLTRFDSDVLAKICYVLECRIEDILEYVPENQG